MKRCARFTVAYAMVVKEPNFKLVLFGPQRVFLFINRRGKTLWRTANHYDTPQWKLPHTTERPLVHIFNELVTFAHISKLHHLSKINLVQSHPRRAPGRFPRN